MSEQRQFELVLSSLHRAMLDGAEWPRTSALIEEACEVSGSSLALGEGAAENVKVHIVGLYSRGECREDLVRDYVEIYEPINEAIPRFRQQPFGRLTRPADIYTETELKTSRLFNEFLRRAGSQNGLLVRLEGPVGCSHISWGTCDSMGRHGDWSSRQTEMIKRLLPHIQQLVFVRQALASAGVLGRSLTELLDDRRLGVVLLARDGKVTAANDRACEVLRHRAGLCDESGVLRASQPAERAKFDQLLTAALPQVGTVPIGGSMVVSGPVGRRLVLHVKPTVAPEIGLHGPLAAAVVLIVDPWLAPSIDVDRVAAVLGLTRAESEVAGWLAEGKTVGEIAAGTGRQKRSIYWLLEQIYGKLGIRRQVDLVRLVLNFHHDG